MQRFCVVFKDPALFLAQSSKRKHSIRLSTTVRDYFGKIFAWSIDKSVEFSVFVSAEIGIEEIITFDIKRSSTEKKLFDARERTIIFLLEQFSQFFVGLAFSLELQF